MTKFDKYDVFMKMLEIIERDADLGSIIVSEEQRDKIVNVIGKIEGGVLLHQTLKGESEVNIGDRFENICESIIATRGSLATGIIEVRKTGESSLADALESLARTIHETPTSEMPEKPKQEALELLDELANQAASPNRLKKVLETHVQLGRWSN